MRELELELAKHERAESRSKKYHKEKQKKLASGKRQPQQQQLRFVLPNAAPTCTAPANTMRPTEMMEDSSITVVQKALRAILGSPNNRLLLQILRVQLE